MQLMFRLFPFGFLFWSITSLSNVKFLSVVETRVPIAILDSGMTGIPDEYLCAHGHRDFTGFGLNDVLSHGTIVAKIIMQKMNKTKHCLMNIKWYHSKRIKYGNYYNVLKYAVDNNARLINISAEGVDYSAKEEQLIRDITDKGVIVVIAAGNKSKNLSDNCVVYPACYAVDSVNFHVVGNQSKNSNRGGPAVLLEGSGVMNIDGSVVAGTSFSAALMSGYLVEKL